MKLDSKTLWNEAGRVGFVFGGFSSLCLLMKEGAALTGSTFLVQAAAIILWAVEFFGCILLMKKYMLDLRDKFDGVTVEDTYRFGRRVALLSGLILAAVDAVLIMKMPQETVESVVTELNTAISSKMGAGYEGEIGRFVDKLPQGYDTPIGENGEETFAMGASVAVSIATNNNRAYVDHAPVQAKGLKVSATSGTENKTDAVAGYSKGDFGLAGAIAIQVNTVQNNALVDENASLTLSGGKLSVTASSTTSFTNNANAKGNDISFVGVGAGVATSVSGVETVARVADDVSIDTTDKGLSGVEITASTTEQYSVTGTAGAAGGFSAEPVTAVLVGGTDTTAILGKGKSVLTSNGDLIISATSNLNRSLTADASAAGNAVGVGGAFAISVLHDNTHAKLSRSTKAKNVTVKTSATNRERTTAKAGANGAASDSGGDQGDSDGDGKGNQKTGTDTVSWYGSRGDNPGTDDTQQ